MIAASSSKKRVYFFGALCFCVFLFCCFRMIAKQPRKDEVYHSSTVNINDYDFEKQGVIPRKTIPLVFVDEHFEVIPYWIREIQRGNLPRKGNTLIHIDGHSDLAEPANLEAAATVKITKQMTLNDMSPMMEGNDKFIVPALLNGIFDSMLWVYPTFSEPRNDTFVNSAKAFGFKRNSRTGCLCKTTKPTSRTPCLLIKEDPKGYDELKYIPGDQCMIVKSLRLKFISEEKLETFLASNWIKNSQNIVLDIDEDFFGVATDYARALNEISVSDFGRIGQEISSLYCPSSAEEEVIIDNILRYIISDIIKTKSSPLHDIEKSIQRTKTHLVREWRIKSRMMCKNSKEGVERSVNFLSTLWHSFSTSQLDMLRRLHFCISHSPMWKPHPGSFSICLGKSPMTQITHQFNANTENIFHRTQGVKKIFKAIFQSVPGPELITVSRSIRDSYTSRPKFREIEDSLLMALKETAFAQKVSLNEEYDINLLFGKRGWVDA